jgi:hypothetical protein
VVGPKKGKVPPNWWCSAFLDIIATLRDLDKFSSLANSAFSVISITNVSKDRPNLISGLEDESGHPSYKKAYELVARFNSI